MKNGGRNDPCPCGSGKKYKKCHGAVTVLNMDYGYNRIRVLDGELGAALTRFGRERFGMDAPALAWEQFVFEDDIPYNSSHAEPDFFDRWYTLDWRPDDGERLPELFLSQKAASISLDLRRLIEATLSSPYSFLQVVDVERGKGLVLRDILRGPEWNVTERSASATLERGHIIYARVVEMDGIFFMMGCANAAIPPRFLELVLNVRRDLMQESASCGDPTFTRTLLDCEDALRLSYFEIAEEVANFKPEIRNTDGDAISLQKLTYSISSLVNAFDALKDLETSATGATDADLYEHAEKNRRGEITEVHLAWLKKVKNDMGGNTALGTLTITNSTLVVETNSEKRSKRIQKEIAKRMGDEAVLLKTEITSQEGVLKQSEQMGESSDRHSDADHSLPDSPEVKDLIKGMMEKHWETWPDIPLPALRGMTPRRAAKDPEGRELLESLLMEFEARNQKKEDDLQRVDISKLRRELGFERR